MAQLSDLREFMRKQAQDDRSRRSVQVSGASIDEALEQASIELNIPLKKIEYEVLESPSSGVLGFGKKNCMLIAYELVTEKSSAFGDDSFDLDFGGEDMMNDIQKDRDGEVIIQLRQDGVFLKVYAPVGNGKKVTEREAAMKLRARGIIDFDKHLMAKVVKNADGEKVRIGDYAYNPMNDALMTVDITDLDMKANIVVKEPGPGGADITADSIIGLLKANGIIHGIMEDEVADFEDHPVFDQPVVVAEGSKPVNGNDAKIIYNFSKDETQISLKEKRGKVDFKEINQIQNVVEGQILARKVPLEEGKPGRTVTGKLLPAKPGNDVDFNIGKNVKLSDDGITAIAEINGQVMLVGGGKLSVEPVYLVNGDVNLKSGGNIIFLGSVMVKGSVEDGFKVKASGNIEVMGNVGKSELDAEGDVIVHQGINGKTEGKVRAGKTVWSKFIENANVDCEDAVIATDGIINSNVVSNRLIACMGKRATIVGGRLRATEEIHAKTLGSVSGSETILEVGWDPRSKEKLQKLEQELGSQTSEIDDIERNIMTLENFKKKKKKLPDDKERYLEELKEQKLEIHNEMLRLEDEIKSIKEYLSSLKYVGKISAASKVFPGVRMMIKDAPLRVRNDFASVTFVNEEGDVKAITYEPLDEDLTKKG
ncbi:MAG: FapA family protein [Spirochaetales bacterium]|uniref:FapA family protein n=1 Tax=Candidatus Thalassospirochaeta sargassi TaxID=3119039 RepID=A0AAJ1IFZ1_9SPIO|nr:FapA family protein [Spirochaetales bacterium]